uniref:hypothetical protein n=1 Tax=Brasilonema sp. UFV-L1 TaxID=2234130 RepID=UPI0030DADC4F
MLQNGVDLYNNDAKVVDCRGIGSCVPYAVLVEGEVFKRQIGMKSAAVNTTRFFSQQGCA